MIMYLLDKQQNIIKALDNTIVEASMIEEINAANKLTFSVMTNSRIDISIHYVCIPAPKGEEFLLFKLISETVKNDRVEYTAVESAYDELKSYAYIKDARPQDKTAGKMLTQILQGTRWSLGYIADTARASTNFYYITVLEAIQKVVDLFNVELTFTVNIDKKTNVISSRRINLYAQQGRRLGKRFEYGSNLLEVTREQSNEDLITALVGRGKGEEVSQGEDGSPDGYGRRITFADIEWKKSNGNPTDKPKGQEYVEDKDATDLYGFSDGKPRIGLTTFEDITDPQELLKATWASLQVAKRPKVSFKASVLDVGDLELGDTVAIIRHDLGIEYFTRVYKVDHDLLDKNNNTIELGDDFSQKSLTNYVSDVAKITENAKNTAEYAVSSANGKNKNYYSKSKPQYANEGDNLFLDLGNGETEYYVWHDGNWELVLSTADTTRVQKQVEEVQRDIADARVEADRLSQEQSKTAKELSDKITDISDKAIKNANDIKSITDDVANVHTDFVNQQANLNQQKKTLDQARQDVLSNSSKIDKLSVGLDSVNINVNNVNSKVDNIKVGGTNLLKGTSRDLQQNSTTNDWVRLPYNTDFFKSIYPLDNFTAKVWIEKPNKDSWLQAYVGGNGLFKGNVIKAGQSGYSEVHGTLNKDITGANLVIGAGDAVSVSLSWKELKLEKGAIATDWSPAPEDEIERVSQLRVDLNGVNATVATNKGDIAQIKLTENGMQQSIKNAQGNISTLQNDSKQFRQQFQDVNGNITTIKNDAKSLSSQLSTKVGTSEYNSFKEQTAQELRTKLTASDLNGYAKSVDVKVSVDGLNARFDNLNVGGTNMVRNGAYNSDNTKHWVTNGVGDLHVLKHLFFKNGAIYHFCLANNTSNEMCIFSDWIDVQPNTDYTLSYYRYGYSSVQSGDTYIQFKHGDGATRWQGVENGYKFNPSCAEYKKFTFRTDGSDKQLQLRFDNNGGGDCMFAAIKLEKGTIASDYSPNPEDELEQLQVLSGKITANSNEFSTVYTKITNVQDVVNSDGGGINLAKHTSNKLANVTASPWLYVGSEGSSSFNNLKDYQGKYMTVRVWIEKPSRDTWVQIWNDKQPIYGNTIKAGQSGYSTASGIIPNGITAWNIAVGNNNNGTTTTFGWKEFKIELGNVATPWSPNPDDVDSDINTAANNARTNAKNDAINAIKGDSQWQSMGKIVTNASFLQNANGFAQEVVKTTTPMVSGGGINLVPLSSNPQLNDWNGGTVGRHAFWKNGNENVFMIYNRTSNEKLSSSPRFKVDSNQKYTISFYGAMSGNTVNYDVIFLGRKNGETSDYTQVVSIVNKQRLSASYMEYKQFTFNVGNSDEGYIRFDNNGYTGGSDDSVLLWTCVKVEKGTVATPYSPAPEDLATKLQLNQVIDTADSHTRTINDYLTGSNSRFTQLSNNVNLKVNKGDVIGQINLEAGRTLLQNQKIYLDADTVGFSGKAFIPSAAIKDLDAGKITTGTLDAANVNVINLNANNITSGSIKGTNLDINLNSGNVSFQKGRIHDSNNYVDINIDQRYISTSNLFTRAILKDGKMQLMDQKLFDITNDYYFEISNEGKGGTQWLTGATLLGKNSVFLGTKNGAANGSVTEASPMGQTKSSGISVDDYQPTLITGSSRGVMIKGGETFRLTTGDTTPYISVGTGQGGISKNRIIIDADYVHFPSVNLKTTSSSPNVYVANDGALVRSTSASKYKSDISRTHDMDYGNKLLELPVATWIDKAEFERYAKKESEQEPVRHFGMIADDLANAGLEMLVTRNNDGELEGIQYDRIAPALIPVISNLKARLELLERKLLNE